MQSPAEKPAAGAASGASSTGVSPSVVAALVVAQFFFGAYSVVSRAWVSGDEGLGYEVFLLYRFLIGATLLTLLARFVEDAGPGPPPRVKLEELFTLAAVYCVSAWTFLGSIGRIGSFIPALGETLIPVYVCAVCAVLRLEAMPRAKAAGMVCAVAGAVLVVVREETRKLLEGHVEIAGPPHRQTHLAMATVVVRHMSDLWTTQPLKLSAGLAMLVVHIIAAGTLLMLKKRLLYRCSPLNLSASTYLVALVWVFLSITWKGNVLSLHTWLPTIRDCYALAFSVCDVVCGTALIAWSTKRTRATTVAASMTLMPFFSALVSWLFIGTALQADQVLGTLLSASGLLLVVWSKGAECEDADAAAERAKLLP
eukprot:TRINITY_DN9640_c0_g1_i1.p1 TRINITY_DN9640_c0_g1~~TRINITY_DN9640_c0_g1_i1.p1  ORF type:complete len:368 (+),score=65.87 TRINITY_DN9640_c0_g1_i1:49-1152(+)